MSVGAGIVGALVGLIAGTLMQVVLVRAPMRERVLGVRPHCTCCGSGLRARSVVPGIAYLTRSNRCVVCESRIWTRLPWLEILTAITLGYVGLDIGFAWSLPAYFVAFNALLAITIVDVQYYMIPNRILYPSLFSMIVLFGLAALLGRNGEEFMSAIAGMGSATVFFWLIWVIYPRGMGKGDVRLAALVGLMTGWLSLANVFLGLFLGVALGGIVGLLAMITMFLRHSDPIPYGPFLVAGGAASVLWGPQIVDAWLRVV